MVILVDTREQLPWNLSRPGIKVRRQTLKNGDYSLAGWSGAGGIILERKSIPDLFGSLTRGLERFEAELERIKESKPGFAAVIVEGTAGGVAVGPGFGSANGPALLNFFFEVGMKWGIAPYLAGDRKGAEALALRLLAGFHATHRKI